MRYQDVYALPNLWLAWSKVQHKKDTTPGVDGMNIRDFERQAERFLRALQIELEDECYRPMPLKLLRIKKTSNPNEKRLLTIPTLRDRVTQHAVLLIIQPKLNGKLSRASFAYRPNLWVLPALRQIETYRQQGYTYVVRLDIEAYFDRIPHDQLAQELRQWVADSRLCSLIEQWIEQSLFYPLGIPQGAVISPLLANLYLHTFDQELLKQGYGLVRYADDLVLLCRDHATSQQALDDAKGLLNQKGLQAHPHKTYISDFERGFDFLGARFENHQLLMPEWLQPHAQSNRILPEQQTQSEQAIKYLQVKTISTPVQLPPHEPKVQVNLESKQPQDNDIFSEQTFKVLQRTLYIQEQGARLQLEQGRWIVSKTCKVLQSIPIEAVDQIVIFGVCGVTPAAVRWCLRERVPLYYLTQSGQYMGETTSYNQERVERHRLQFESQQQSGLSLAFAKSFVQGKLRNTRLLLRYLRKQHTLDCQSAIDHLHKLEQKAGQSERKESLLGYEGSGAVALYDVFKTYLPVEWGFAGRLKQPPKDPVNAMLSLGYTLLFKSMQAWLMVHKLHPDVSYLHALRNGHAALASDLIEEFRAPIVDLTVIQMIQQKCLNITDFEVQADGAYHLSSKALKIFIGQIEKRLQTVVKHPVLGQQVSLQRCLEVQVLQLLAVLEGRQIAYQAYSPANW